MMINDAHDADDIDGARLRLSGDFVPAENWDDDFEFQSRGVDQAHNGKSDATNAPERAVNSNDQEESWDDAYEDPDPDTSPVKRSSKIDDEEVEDWDSSDNEGQDEPEPEPDQNLNNETQREFVSGFEEEDKTVTARSHSSRALASSSVPPIPVPLAHIQNSKDPPGPSASFLFHVSQVPSQYPPPPTSPTLSSFSIPLSSHRASVYSNEPLMPTTSNGSVPHLSLSTMRAYPQSAGSTPPRKGRRLRKKSRPPEADIFELEDREPDPLPVPESPAPPPAAPPSPPRPATPPTMHVPLVQPTPSPSLLTRIGSLKKWARRSLGPEDPAISGSRRGKSSTAPSEAGRTVKSSVGPEELAFAEEHLEQDPRTVSPTPAPTKSKLRRSRGDSASGQKAGWFFRAGGGGGAESEQIDTPTATPSSTPVPLRTPDPSPSKRSTLGLRRRGKEPEEGATPTPKTARGSLIPALRAGGSAYQVQAHSVQTRPVSMPPPPQSSHSMQFPRHHESTSVGRSSGSPISAMVSAAGISTRDVHAVEESREREGGMRSLMNGVRRLSLVNAAHKRRKSTYGDQGPKEGERNDGARRPQSRTEDRPASRASATSGDRRPASQVLTNGVGSRHIAEGEIVPPVVLDSPATSHFPVHPSSPWSNYDPINGVPAGSPSTGDSPVRDSGVTSTFSPPPTVFSPLQQHRPERQSFTASATSLLTGSPTRTAPAPTPPLQAPTTPQRSGTPSDSRPIPTSSQTLPSSSPRTPHSASLGRSTPAPALPAPSLRRNSLGDLKIQTPPRGELKIPARISRAQQGLRRDLGMVREFAASVEQLKRLQGTYTSLIGELRAAYDASPISPDSRPISPVQVQYHLPSRPPSQTSTARRVVAVNPNPSLQSVHQGTTPVTQPHSSGSSHRSRDIDRQLARLENEYGIWWECAELLVELGGGSVSGTASNPNLAAHSGNPPAIPVGEPFKELLAARDDPLRKAASGLQVTSVSEPGSIFEQAIVGGSTSKGPPQASPPHPAQWRASTGRHDLSARQLRLLKDMLNTPDPASLAYVAGPYGYGEGYPHAYSDTVQEGEDAQQWAPWNPSTLTLPSEESSTDPHLSGASYGRANIGKSEGKEKKRRAVNRLGMLGLRDMLRGLKRNAIAEGRLDRADQNGQLCSESSASASNSAEDDHYNCRHSPWHQHDEHHGNNFTANSEEASALELPPPTRNGVPPKSPRRPSLASIFRLGQKSSKNGSKSKEPATNGNGNSTTEEELPNDAGGGGVGEYSDWERMSRSDLDLTATPAAVGSGTATVRGKKKLPLSSSRSNPVLHSSSLPGATPERLPTTSQTSLQDMSSSSPPQPSKLPLSIAEEDSSVAHDQNQKDTLPGVVVSGRLRKERTASWSRAITSSSRPGSRDGKKGQMTGTVRSAPPRTTDVSSSLSSSAADPKLALTPENIKPLLEYAREVSVRLGECIGEVRSLLSAAAALKAVP